MVKALETDMELWRGRAMYEAEAVKWPSPIGWDNLEKGTQYLWIERAKKVKPVD